MAHKIKITVVGDAAVGKSSLIRSLIKHPFQADYNPTVFDEYVYKYKEHDLLFADTPGQEDYEKVRTTAYEGTHVFIVCFSLDHKRSFDRIADWLADPLETPITIRSFSGAPAILVGIKADLRKSDADKVVVTSEEAIKMEEDVEAFEYVEVSALDNTNVEALLDKLVDAVTRKDNKGHHTHSITEDLPFDEGTLTVRAIKATNLKAGDSNGFSDPFFVVGLFGNHHFKALGRSKTIKKTLNPVWNEDIVIDLTARKIHRTEGLAIQVWDEDLIGKDFLGSLHFKWDVVNNLGLQDPVSLHEDEDIKEVGVKGTLSFSVSFKKK